MASPTFNNVVRVCEDTDGEFDIPALLQEVGYTPGTGSRIVEAHVRDASGNYVPAPTTLFSLVDGDTVRITASNMPDWFGSFDTLMLVINDGQNTVNLELQVIVEPVNDAPEGADKSIALTDGLDYVLTEGDFGFEDPVERNGFESVVISSLPAAGWLLLNGSPVAAGTEVAVGDIRSGALVFRPWSQSAGSVAFGFQVRDDGGTEGCNAVDLDATPNYITFEVPTASLGDRVWYDTNGDGRQGTGEAGAAGVRVDLLGAGADGSFGTGDDVTATTTTDAGGYYRFDGLAAGQYQVTFGGKAGYDFTTQNIGTDDAHDSDANGVTGASQVVTLAAGQSNMTVDAGLVKGSACLGDRVWYDSNGNGRQDSGEAGVSGVTVTLKGAGRDGVFGTDDDVGATTTTNSGGYYSFNGLAAGQYQVIFGARNGYAFTQRDAGSNDSLDSDADANGASQVVTLSAGQSNMTIDAGLLCKPAVPCAKIVGCDTLYEGSYGAYRVQLDFAVKTDTTFWVSASDGSAGRTTTWAGNQQIAAGGYCTGYDRYGRFTYYDNQYYDANGRLQKATGPADQRWDYALYDTADNIVGASGGFYVTVKAGQTSSGNFWVDAWQEQVHVDRRVMSSGYKEAAWENFSLTLSTYSKDVSVCEPAKKVSIGDTSCYQLYSPIVLDLDGNGIQTTALIDSRGSFDLLGTGRAVQSGWISAGDAFLAVDANGNGCIDGIGELFGGDKGEGFAKLATYGSNHDGVLDANDADFAKLLVWQDGNGNHATDAGELRTLAEAGIASLDTAYTDQAVNQLGNVLGEASSATRTDGSSIDMVDVYFNLALEGDDAAPLPTLQALLGSDDTLLDQAFGAAPDVAGAPLEAVSAAAETEALRALAAAMKHADAGLSAVC
ncbi:SdrD B-like domain-containing protein [Aquincola sp. MAHUQ-54]|uniref:SdrD B-like domain-containing protein n=1 Tax=Aquincola agrisoli TaxID=3119538 RepID=A0AAW9QBY1_9BURK